MREKRGKTQKTRDFFLRFQPPLLKAVKPARPASIHFSANRSRYSFIHFERQFLWQSNRREGKGANIPFQRTGHNSTYLSTATPSFFRSHVILVLLARRIKFPSLRLSHAVKVVTCEKLARRQTDDIITRHPVSAGRINGRGAVMLTMP